MGATDVAPEAGVNISFEDITYTVVKGDRKIEILKGISGGCLSGRVLAIMGSSGAGKTTLLDILACHAQGSGIVGGSIQVNNKPLRVSKFRRVSCYVLQRDVLLASSTVRESLMISAQLKLPRSMSSREKMSRVENIIQELDLEGCQHTLIGDEAQQMKGISGGQKRRVSVGMELVKDPRVLFLDEPTSGLDSEMAASLMDTLVTLARKGRTVVATIHQPSSRITSQFDDFMLLALGRLIYYGPWAKAVDFFEAGGHPCPLYQNPTEHFLSVLRDTEVIDTLADRWQQGHGTPSCGDLEEGKNGSTPSLTNGNFPQAVLSIKGADDAEDDHSYTAVSSAPPASFVFQVYVLMGRMFRMWLRNPAMLTAELIQYIFLAIFIGLMYLRLNHSIATGVNDRIASMWFALAILSFTPSYTAVTQWERERVLLRRETQGGMYTIRSWFLAKTATVTPVQAAQTAFFVVVSYFMVGYVADAPEFFLMLAVFVMFQLTSESIGVLSSAFTTNATYATLVLTFVLLFCMSFSGFLVSDIPVYFRWISKINYLTYAISAVTKSQFNATTFYDGQGQPVSGSQLIPSSLDNGLSVGENTWVLFGLMVATRLLAWLAIELGAITKFI